MPFEKKSLGQKAKGALTKIFALAVLVGGPIAGTGYYHYGTQETQEVKVRSVEKGKYLGWDYTNYQSLYEPGTKISTDKGDFDNLSSSLFHFKSQNDTSELQNQFQSGKVYRVTTYGGWFGNPNLLSAVEVTPEEMKQRKEAEDARKAEEAALQQQQQGGQASGGAVVQPGTAKPPAGGAATPTPTALSGATSEIIITAHGYDIKLTVPTEVINKVRVEEVKKTEPVRIVQPPAPGS